MGNKEIKGKVLIVEDDTLLSLLEERLVVNLGYKVIDKAVSGEEAIEKVKIHQPDVVIMDLSLEGSMDGIDTMNAIKSFSDVPVIYLSGSSDKHHMERAKKTNIIEYLFKPVSADQMIRPLKKAMSLKKDAPDDVIRQAG